MSSYDAQMADVRMRVDKYYADMPATFPLTYKLWSGTDRGRPRFRNDWDGSINILIRHVNELSEQVKDLQFQINEMNEDT